MRGHGEGWRHRVGHIMERMSGRLTPPEVTPLDGIQIKLLPVADLFMILMLSRPPGGSLRTARVTPSTIWLAGAFAVLACIAGPVMLGRGLASFHLLSLVVGLVIVAFGFGAAVLAVFGVRQRLLIAARQRPSPPPPRGGEN